MDGELLNVFCELVKIPSPSGRELGVARYIQTYLKRIYVDSFVDGVGKMVGSNSGNVIANVGIGKPKILFLAHMDTVEDGTRGIAPIVRSGIIRSDGKTILGADDKAGVAALLVAIKELKSLRNILGVMCVFSVREEAGVMGVKHLKIDKGIKFAFDVDGSNPPGIFVNRALGCQTFEIQIYGKSAHAAGNPEKGRNAIMAMAILISKLRLGKNTQGSTTNIGTISGGERPNVIPNYAVLTGETRAYALSGIEKNLRIIERTARNACAATGCRYKLIKRTLDAPLNVPETSKIVRLARKASAELGIKFSLMTLSATMQGSAIASKGHPTLGLSKGGASPHSFSERIAIKEIEDTKKLILGIVQAYK